MLGYCFINQDPGEELAQIVETISAEPNCTTEVLAQMKAQLAEQNSLADDHAALTIWFIDNMPDGLDLHHHGYCMRDASSQRFEKIKSHWLAQVQSNPENPKIIAAAAKFYSRSDLPLAESFYRMVIALEPDEPYWLQSLARLLDNMGKDRADDALKTIQAAVSLERGDQHRLHLLSTQAGLAFNAGNIVLAAETAQEMLKIISSCDLEDCGDAVHASNSMLGRIALKQGNTKLASEHLLAAGKAADSPVLGSFGPNMVLAEQLLDAGQRDCVIAYLNDCKSFWNSRDKIRLLEKGIKQIKAGIRPCFKFKFADYGCKQNCTCVTKAFV